MIDTKFSTLINKLTKIDELEQSISFLSNKYDELCKKINNLNVKAVIDENTRLASQIRNSANEIDQIKEDLNEMEQYIRRDCLELRGIPSHNEEDTNEIVRKVGDLVDIDIKTEDISVSHRLPAMRDNSDNSQAKAKREPAVIVKFVRRDVRDALYKARSKLRSKTTRDIGFTRQQSQKIFIAESLTRKKHLLFNRCLQIKKELNYQFIWTHYGKILLRKDGSSPVMAINTEKDLDKLR